VTETATAAAKPNIGKQTARPSGPPYEIPKFELSKMAIPAAFSELADKSVAQAKENREEIQTAGNDMTAISRRDLLNRLQGPRGRP
jgi:hypothetical protein